MQDTQLYRQILGIEKPWKVAEVQVSLEQDEVEVTVAHGGRKLLCRKCGKRRKAWCCLLLKIGRRAV